MISIKQRFSAALRQQLKTKAWSQKKLAEHIKRSPSTISLWLTGRQLPRLDNQQTITKLSEFFEIDKIQLKDIIANEKYESDEEVSQHKKLTIVKDEDHLLEILPDYARWVKEQVQSPQPHRTIILASGVIEKLREYKFDASEKFIKSVLKKWKQTKHSELKRRSEQKGLSRDELLGAFQKNYRDNPWIRDAIRRLCHYLTDYFLSKKNAPFFLDDVLEQINEQLKKSMPVESKQKNLQYNLSELLLEMMLKIRFLIKESDKNANEIIHQHYEFSPEYLINRLFGISINISNFDFLFDGGLLMPVSTGQSLLVKGRAGTGKTTLALQIAASMASKGNLSVYLSAEEKISLLTERLSFIGCSRITAHNSDNQYQTISYSNQEYILMCSNSIDEKIINTIDDLLAKGKGTMLIVSIPNREDFFEKSELLSNLTVLLKRAINRDIYCNYTIDSLDAVAKNRERNTFEKIFSFAKKSRNLAVFLSEYYEDGNISRDHQRKVSSLLQDYLVDTVIRMDYITRVGFKERVLEIEKCRGQNHIRGKHMFSIRSQFGITVYPSVQALLSIWRKRIRPEHILASEHWTLDKNFESLCEGDIMRGSANLLKGPPATFKLVLGLSFLASKLLQDNSSPVLLISLSEDEASLIRTIHSHPQFNCLLKKQDNSCVFNPLLKVLYFPPDYYTAERFLHRIRGAIREIKQVHRRSATRVLFSNVDQLFINSPLFSEERLFLAGLIELFKKEGITSLFISVGHTSMEIEQNFETIIFTSTEGAKQGIKKKIGVDIRSSAFNKNRIEKYLSRNGNGLLQLTSIK